MDFDVPEGLRYLESHEWAQIDSIKAQIGITDFAQDELGDVVFVELPAVGDKIDAKEAFGVVESIKAVSDLYAPISGEVTAVNEALFNQPELVNDDPFDDGWMLQIAPSDETELDELLSAAEYREQIA